MSIYREWRLCKDWRRFFLDIEIQFAAGRHPKPTVEELEWREALAEVWTKDGKPYVFHEAEFGSARVSGFASKPDEYSADDTYPAHIECPEAHLGHVTTPAGAQDFQVVTEAGGWRAEPRALNPVSQTTGD